MIDGQHYDGPDAAVTFNGRPRTWGLRLSVLDCVVLIGTVIATVVLWLPTEGLSVIAGLVVGHFFLFCNVFRIPRKPELVWGGLFLAMCVALLLLDCFTPAFVCGFVVPITLAVLTYSLRLPTYHGIYADRVNPRLDDYLTGRTDAEKRR